MSKIREGELECPSCGHSQKVTLWDSINVTLDPGLREDLFNGKINVFICDACEEEAFIPIPLMYHDMERTLCVQYYPFNYEHEDEGILNWFTIEGKLKVDDYSGMSFGEYVFDPHIVLSPNEMIRYILFRETLFENYPEGKGKD